MKLAMLSKPCHAKNRSNEASAHPRGQYMTTSTPSMAMPAPMMSKRSGTVLSTCQPHRIDGYHRGPRHSGHDPLVHQHGGSRELRDGER